MNACIFDLDGTLTDTLSTIAFYVNKSLKKFGFDSIDIEHFKYFAGNGRDILLHRALAHLGIDTVENFIKVGAEYDKLYENDTIGLSAPFDGICEMLDRLKEMGIKIAVLSNKPHNVTLPFVKSIFGDNCFDIIYGQRPEVKLKPHPQGAYIVADELGVLPENCIFIGDTDNDILTGINAGMKTIGVLWGFRDEKELLSAGADFIVSIPSQIPEIVSELIKE